MKRGVSLWQATHHTDGSDLVAALDEWAAQAGRYPHFVPVWVPLPKSGVAPRGGRFPTKLLNELRTRGVEPMVYAHSVDWIGHKTPDPAFHPQTYLAGDHDAMLDAFAQAAQEYGHRLIVRLDQEPSLGWAPWSGPPKKYIAAWRYISDRLRRAPNVRMYWCAWNANMDYYPGNRWCDFVGFDVYSRGIRFRSLRSQWRKPIANIRARTDKPIIVGEFGRKRGRPLRWLWMRSLRKVRGVWACVYFDIDMRPTENVNWTMSPWMRREFMRR